MKLYYFKTRRGNFGDDLNPWLWPKLMQGILDGQCFHSHVPKQYNEEAGSLFLGIGTLLNTDVPKRPLKAVFGTGVGYGETSTIDERWKFYCVRGPLSAKALGLTTEHAITDAAALLRILKLPQPSKIKHKFSFMPHHESYSYDRYILPSICEAIGINYVDPTAKVEAVLENLLSSEIVITEAMHGAIVADALRIPWIPVKINNSILEFKWYDWCKSLKLEYQPATIPYSFHRIARQKRLINKGKNIVRKSMNKLVIRPLFIECMKKLVRDVSPTLSSDSTIEIATSRLLEKFDEFKTDYAAGYYEPAKSLS